ncbi:MAG: D-alanyl-D-alanine carboxypeptidase [Firmicutes bacterium]|nr:D-alanyl-D-alanine carboxypeptidase [Bacillota bacterium]
MKKNKFTFLTVVLLCTAIGMIGGLMDYLSPSVNADEDILTPPQQNVSVSASAPVISAAGAILADAATGEVLFEKDADKKLYPASTTKILTALIALEKLEELGLDMSCELIVTNEAQGVEGSSVYLKAGERITMEELLYGLMLQSGNDSAVAIASCMGGSSGGVSNFVDMMNKRALDLGCRGSHFVNPHGLFDENHYVTARDMALIAAEAMKREDFRQIVGAEEWAGGTEGRRFLNKNKTIAQYEGATGVKIGFTKKSGRTLVASAKRGDVELIAVVLNDGNWFADAYDLLDYGFEIMSERGERDGI